MKTLIFVLLTSFALNAFACLAMLTGEAPGSDVTEKVCIYNHLGDTVTSVISSGSYCPTYLSVDH